MCVIFFYVTSNPRPGGYKLILASNRDEFFARDTLKVTKWEKAEHCYGGIDLEPGREGGTWLAISNLEGVTKVGALLNLSGEPKHRDPAEHNFHHHQHHDTTNTNTVILNKENIGQEFHFNHNVNNNQTNNNTEHTLTSTTTIHANHLLLGRGMIVADYVKNYQQDFNNETYNDHLAQDCIKYNAFNFVSIEIGSPSKPAEIRLVSNVPPSLTRYDEGQCYGFGNSLPKNPFVKVQHGTMIFEDIIRNFIENSDESQDDGQQQNEAAATIEENENESKENTQNMLVEKLMNLLKNKEKFWPDPELEKRAPNWGEYLSSLNVYVPDAFYGSRTHTVILLDHENKMHFYEETMDSLDPQGEWTKSYIEKQFAKTL